MVLGPPQSTFPCCVNLSLESERVDPGDSVLLNVSFDSTHRPGSFFANIVVPVVSGSDKEAFFFRLTGDVTETIVLDPEVLFLEPGKSGKFLVKSERYKTGLKIEKVESQVSSVTIVPGPVEGTTQSFEVKVSGSGEGLPTTLRLVTNDKEIPDMLIAVTLSAPAPHSH